MYDYKISRAMYNSILKTAKGKVHPKKYVIGFIENEFGLIGKIRRLLIEG